MKEKSINFGALLFSLFTIYYLLFTLSGCGYRPSGHYSKAVMQGTVSTEIEVSMQDPENAVRIKDVLNRAVIIRFGSSLRDRGYAATHLKIKLEDVVFTPLKYDQNGYIITYQAKTTLDIQRSTGNIVKFYKASGVYDFSIEPNAIISDYARLQAIKIGSSKALDSFVAQVAAEGMHESRP